MKEIYRVAGYVKLAKLWERSKDEAVALHQGYFQERVASEKRFELQGIYIDITGNKNIYRRREMVRLLKQCQLGVVDVILAQTRAYLAANAKELSYLLKYLDDLPFEIEIVTDDEDKPIDTIQNYDHQKESLKRMADNYVSITIADYQDWRDKLLKAMNELEE